MIKTKPFEPEKYFKTSESQARLLTEALATGESSYVAAVLGVIARARGMSDVAVATGLNRQALYSALCEDGNPTLDTVMKVLDALGVRLKVAESVDA